jgi:hypothetical protein
LELLQAAATVEQTPERNWPCLNSSFQLAEVLALEPVLEASLVALADTLSVAPVALAESLSAGVESSLSAAAESPHTEAAARIAEIAAAEAEQDIRSPAAACLLQDIL